MWNLCYIMIKTYNAHRGVFLCFVFLMFVLPYSFSQERAVFDHYTTKHGLTSNRIYDLTQDSLGFIWMATDFGLNRYNGVQFEQFKRADYPALARDEILTIKALNKEVFAGSSAGLIVRYDYDKRDFKALKPENFDTASYKEVRGFYLPQEGERYAFTVSGLYLYDKQTDNFTASFPAFLPLIPLHVRSMFMDSHNRFWVGTVDCLLVFSHEGKMLKNFETTQKTRDYVTDILEYETGKILVTSFSNEIWFFDTKADSIGAPRVVQTPFSNVTHVAKDKKGRFWFSTDGYGLWYSDVLPSQGSDFKQIIPFGASQNDIRKIYAMLIDCQGDLWIGTQNSGLWRYRQNASGVVFSASIGFPEIVCADFAEDKAGNIYVATDGDGIYKLSSDYKKIERTCLKKGNILSLNWMKDSTLLISTWGDGILRLDVKNDKLYAEDLKGIASPLKCFLNINPAHDGKYWAASAGDGLYVRRALDDWYCVILTDEKIDIPDNWVMRCLEGKPGTIWAMTTRSLWMINGDKKKSLVEDAIKQKSYNPTSFIDGVCDDDGNLFAVSNNGVIRVDKDGESVEQLDFLPNELMTSVLYSGGSEFWVTGASGIISFDYNTKKCVAISTPFEDKGRTYFYSRSSFQDSKGRRYFGTKDGFVVIDKGSTLDGNTTEYFSWGDLYVSGKYVFPHHDVLKDGPLSSLSVLSLPYDKTDVVITFDVIDYLDPQGTVREYRLKGLNDEWKDLGSSLRIPFTHIPHGNYELQVRLKKNSTSGAIVENMITLPISVLPPWWTSWWVRLIMIASFLVAILLIFRWRMKKYETEQRILEDRVEVRTHELRQALSDKGRIISVLAHDLKNPMFAIVGALDNLNSKSSFETNQTKRMLGDVGRSAHMLQDEMLRLLEWAQAKDDEIVPIIKPVNADKVVSDAIALLKGMTENKNIEILVENNIQNFVLSDVRMLSTVVRNILTNAVKFTNEGGQIKVSLWQNDKGYISVEDNGVGMNRNVIDEIYKGAKVTSTQGTNNEKGTGLGLALCREYIIKTGGEMQIESEVDKGTRIIVSMPLSDAKIIAKNESTTAQNQEFTLDSVVDKELLADNTILIVDDDNLICENLNSILSPYVNTLIAHNGQEALSQIETNGVDIVLSDVDMPTMDGIEMAKIILSDDRTRHIPLIFLSAKNDDTNRLSGLLSGAVDYIAKPFRSSELLVKVVNLLKIRRLQQEKILAEYLSADKKQVKKEAQGELNPFVKKLISVIEEKYIDGDFSIDDLCNAMCVSQSTLQRRVKSIIGKTPVEIINEYRLNKAHEMLSDVNTENSVSDIAFAVGFRDASYFTRKFKEHFGYLPSSVEQK